MPSNASQTNDLVNSPAHYTQGRFEAIDVIEDVIRHAPDPISGMLLGNTLKYLLRVWFKACPHQDASKARWYLDRLLQHLEAQQRVELYKCLEDNPPAFDDPLQ
jgi:hypothetical protein